MICGDDKGVNNRHIYHTHRVANRGGGKLWHFALVKAPRGTSSIKIKIL